MCDVLLNFEALLEAAQDLLLILYIQIVKVKAMWKRKILYKEIDVKINIPEVFGSVFKHKLMYVYM